MKTITNYQSFVLAWVCWRVCMLSGRALLLSSCNVASKIAPVTSIFSRLRRSRSASKSAAVSGWQHVTDPILCPLDPRTQFLLPCSSLLRLSFCISLFLSLSPPQGAAHSLTHSCLHQSKHHSEKVSGRWKVQSYRFNLRSNTHHLACACSVEAASQIS